MSVNYGDCVQMDLVEIVPPDPLLRGHPRVVAAVEGQLEGRAVEAEELLDRFGLSDRLHHRPRQHAFFEGSTEVAP